jgi:hypothetical protein
LKLELRNHTDGEFVKYLVNGFTHGFDTKVKDVHLETRECRNLLSACQNPTVVDNLLSSEIEKGFLSGPYKTAPFKNYRVSPLGVAERKYTDKKRLIVDLSSPHNRVNHPSINDLIDKNECSLSYVSIDDAITSIINFGKDALMCKTDISDAFKLVPILPSQYHLFCVKWRNLYYFYTRLAFGCRSSPKIFDQFSQAICWIAKNNYDIECILHLLDDFLTIDRPDYPADRTMALLTMIFNRLNVPLAKHKTMGPATVMEYLGIILDSHLMQARLPMDKVTRIREMLDNFCNKKSCTKRELLQLLGHLNFASRVIVPGRSFVSYLLCLASSVRELHHRVHLNSACREDLIMWKLFIEQWNGVSFFYEIKKTPADSMHLYTDASSTIGFGGYFQGHWFCDKWPHELPKEEDKDTSMAFRELYPIVIAALLWGHQWSTKRILFHCDNETTVKIIHKGRSKALSIMKLMRQLTWCSAQHNFCIYSEHLPGKTNLIADALSRFQMEKFRHLAPAADSLPQPCPTLEQVLWKLPTE